MGFKKQQKFCKNTKKKASKRSFIKKKNGKK